LCWFGTNADGSPASFNPHDFRRIFATEAVAAGLPAHIAAKILGHESIARPRLTSLSTTKTSSTITAHRPRKASGGTRVKHQPGQDNGRLPSVGLHLMRYGSRSHDP
jgi:hypothetical protein